MAKNNKNDIFKTMRDITEKSKKIIGDTKSNLEIMKLRNRQDDHKYNIGKIVFDKNIAIDDTLIKSNIKSIKEIMSDNE